MSILTKFVFCFEMLIFKRFYLFNLERERESLWTGAEEVGEGRGEREPQVDSPLSTDPLQSLISGLEIST